MSPGRLIQVLLFVLGSLLGACARTSGNEQELTVFAAASLREAFEELRVELATKLPDSKVAFNFAGSQELRTQLEHGAPADVFASADRASLEALVRAGRLVEPTVFAENEPVIVVAPSRASDLRSLQDLVHAERLVIGAPQVPIGRYTEQILEKVELRFGEELRQKIEARVVSRELNVRQVLTKVSLGEADAGIVYRSDVRAAQGQVVAVLIAPELNARAEYVMALSVTPSFPNLARAWIELVRSPLGQRALTRAGFLMPEDRVAAP